MTENASINFSSENDFLLSDEEKFRKWLIGIIFSENKEPGEILFVFCDDDFLLKINQEFLQHDTYTDIISFDYTVGKVLHGEIYISTERIEENAQELNNSPEEELRRVMAHGILHLCGFKDKTQEEANMMRAKEDEKLMMFHVEQ